MHDRERIAKEKTTGPFAPPLPKTVESEEAEPMAVANDKATRQDESFRPTSAPLDQFDGDVARRYKQVPGSGGDPATGGHARSKKETAAMQDPPAYDAPDARGWSRLRATRDEDAEGNEGRGGP